MNCILLFHFILLFISITLLILGISTSKWFVYIHENTTGIISSEYSNGIIKICQRLYRQGNTNQYSFMYNWGNNDSYINDDVYICFNRLFKWYNAAISGPELLDYQKVLIVTSFSCVFIAVISLLLTQFINTEASFYKIRLSKRIIDCLLITNILTVILALLTLALFFGFEHLQKILNYGYSFWLFVLGTCCIFLCCILLAVFRIDVEFEFHHYQQESIATHC